MNVHLRAVQPAGFAVPAAAHLHTGVAGARSEAADFEAEFEIVKFTLVQQPHKAVVGLPARVACDDAVIGLPKSPVNIGRFGLNAPAIQRTAIEKWGSFLRRGQQARQKKSEPAHSHCVRIIT